VKAKFVYENMGFERGQDPKSSMGIGKKEFRLLTRLDAIAKNFGFERMPIEKLKVLDGPDPDPARFKDIALWVHSKYNYLVLFYERKRRADDDPDRFSVFTVYPKFGTRSEDDKPAEWFLDEKNWIIMFGPDINENNF